MDTRNDSTPGEKPAFDPDKWGPDPVELRQDARKRVYAVLAFFAFAIAYRLVVFGGFGRTGLMFVGLPAVVAVLLALAQPAKSSTGAIAKGITFVLLVLAPLVGEGYLCILIASPLFYCIGVIIGALVDYSRRSRGGTVACVALLMLPMCLEGVSPQWSLPRAQVVEAVRVVAAPEASVRAALAEHMQIERALPGFLKIGFPRPLEAWGSGLRVGDERGLHFSGAEGTPPGDLRMRVAESREGYVRMQTVSDGSKVTEWLHWRDTEVGWHALDATHTQVTARVHFDRGLDPAWYFTAWERFAAEKAAEYLITANATPAGAR